MCFSGEPLNGTNKFLTAVPEKERDLLVVDFQEVDGIPSGDFPIVLARVTLTNSAISFRTCLTICHIHCPWGLKSEIVRHRGR